MPVIGLLAAFILLGERPSVVVFGGAAIILTGLALVVGLIGQPDEMASENVSAKRP